MKLPRFACFVTLAMFLAAMRRTWLTVRGGQSRPGRQQKWITVSALLCLLLLLPRLTMGQQRIGTVNLGVAPQAIGIDPTTNTIYVVNFFGTTCCQGPGTLTIINGDTLATSSITVGSTSASMASEPISMAIDPDNHKVFVIDSAPFVNPAGDITFVDISRNPPSTATTFDFNSYGPQLVAVDPKTARVWVANQASDFNNNINANDATLTVWDANGSGPSAFVATVSASAPLGTPQAMVIDSSRGWVYLSGAINNLAPFQSGVTAIREANIAPGVRQHVSFPQASALNPGELAVDEATNTVYLASFHEQPNFTFNAAIIVLPGTPTAGIYTSAEITIDLGFAGNAQQPGAGMILGLNPVTHHLFVGTPTTVMVVDGSNPPNYPISTVSNFPANMTINSLVVDPSTNKVYATGLMGTTFPFTPTLVTIDGIRNTVISSITLTNTSDFDNGGLLALNQITGRLYAAGASQSGAASLVLDVVDTAPHTVTSVPDPNSQGPNAIAANLTTHKVYVGNTGFDAVTGLIPTSVSVFDALKGTVQTVFDPSAINPSAVAADPIRSKTYVANSGSNNVTVIDTTPTGGQDTYAMTIPLTGATGPSAIAVDATDGKVYTANNGSNNVSVNDGISNQLVATVPVGAGPIALAVDAFNSRCTPGNPVLRRIFVVNNTAGTVSALDPDNNLSTVGTVTVGGSPTSIIVTPCPANQAWVTNSGSNNVSMFDAENLGAATTVTDASASQPVSSAFNPNTGKLYVANENSNSMTIIDTTTFGFPHLTVPVGLQPASVAVDPNSNRIYVANFGSLGFNSVSIINGETNSVSMLTDFVAGNPIAIVVDPALGNAYAANSDQAGIFGPANDELTEVSDGASQTIPLQSSVTPLTDNGTTSLTPTFNWTTSSTFTPNPPPVNNVFFRIDDVGTWMQATNNGGGSFSSTPTLQPGQHTMYSFATDGQEATLSNQLSPQGQSFGFNLSPFVGGISSYTFVAGATSSTITPVSVTVSTQPAGLSFTVDGTSYSTSQTFAWQPGSSHSIGTTTPQTVSGASYAFSNWSDGGAINHTVAASAATPVYTATFAAAATVSVTVGTQPAGLSFAVDGASYSASQTFTWVVGSSHSIGTTTPQTASGASYAFSNWSDGGAINHTVAASSTTTAYTATFAITSPSDVSSVVSVQRLGFRFNFFTRQFFQTDILMNNGASALAGPIYFVLDNLSANAHLSNATGTTTLVPPIGSPYITVVPQGGMLAPGASVSVNLQFVDPSFAPISYNTTVLQGGTTTP